MSTQPGNRVIEITVNPSGQVVVQTTGFAGASCQDATRLIERALGERTSESLTPEYHQAHTTPQRVERRR